MVKNEILPERTVAEDKEKELLEILRKVAPGRPLREGLENILRAKTGALIVLGDNPAVMEVAEGGFAINAAFTPAALYELAKMDGAIILTEDAKRIIAANTQLIPKLIISSSETGIRHRTAERVAKQTGVLVISISQRREVISLYKGAFKYILKDTGVILTKANQAIQTLEKYHVILNQVMLELSKLEFEEAVILYNVVKAIQRVEMVLRVVKDIEFDISELGVEGRMLAMQVEELEANVADEGLLIIQDYAIGSDKSPAEILNIIGEWPAEDLLDLVLITRVLGYSGDQSILDQNIIPKGYRALHKVPRLPVPVIENLVNTLQMLPNISKASIEQLDEVEGIGEVRARSIKYGLSRYRDKLMQDRYII
ncbi:MAG: DNA integrity scanning diadenylate cyclase DisA [Desulfotomaculum sp.]|nr:DNA integrity scanning diadenylate cyclase DisA [Desulfotomaculum sp.]MCL0081084.1 DNA integrity scanning diadenylate cyclase DisA [Peptococcaceae bacterium]